METTFKYEPMFQVGEDNTEYYLLTKDYVSVSEFEGKPILKIPFLQKCLHSLQHSTATLMTPSRLFSNSSYASSIFDSG